jgi:hypothetical protein
MFDRLKRSLVESFVGALALGWVFAWAILDFASIFSAPLTGWIVRSEYRKVEGLVPGVIPAAIPGAMLYRDALPDLASSSALFLIGYMLLRWLYFKPPAESTDPIQRPD